MIDREQIENWDGNESEDVYMVRAYNAARVGPWAWTLQTPPDSPDNDVELGVGAADAFPPLSGQHREREAELDELQADLRRGAINGGGAWSGLCKRANLAIQQLRGGW